MVEITDRNKLLSLSNLCFTRNRCIGEMNSNKNEKDSCLNIVNKRIYCFGAKWCYFWRIAIIIFLIILIVIEAEKYFSARDFETAMVTSLIIVFLVFALIGMLIWTIYKVKSSISHHNRVINAKKRIEVLNENINTNLNQIDSLSKQIAEYNWLPEAYWFAGSVIITYILNRRADSLKEAINLFEYERRSNIQFNQQMEALQKINQQLIQNKNSNNANAALISGAAILSGFIR